MSPCLSITKHWQTAAKYHALACGFLDLSILAIVAFGLLSRTQAARNILRDRRVSTAPTKNQPKLAASYGKLPLSFEANQGQTDARVRFLARSGGYNLFLTGDEAVLEMQESEEAPTFSSPPARVAPAGLPSHLLGELADLDIRPTSGSAGANVAPTLRSARAGLKPGAMTALRMRLIGANASAPVIGVDELPGRSNYFIGNDPKKWRRNVPNYSKVKYQNVYPGVDLVYYGNQGQLEYDFVVAPGANPRAIVLAVGAVRDPPAVSVVSDRRSPVGTPALQESAHRGALPQITPNGDMVVKTDGGEVSFQKPVVYQPGIISGQRTPVEGDFVLQANNHIGFKVAPYDHTKPLVIDPVLVYSTYLGGSYSDQGNGIAVDSFGYAYVTGYTASADFPTVDPLQATDHAYPNSNVFVSKINPTGSALVYSTFLGGTGFSESGVNSGDIGYGIAVDSSGNAYVTGDTDSLDFPTLNPLQATYGGAGDAFLAKLDATGSALVYSTYLGGSYFDHGQGIAVDSSGSAYVTGSTCSTDFPTVNPLQATDKACYNTFVTKFNGTGSALVYSTFLGGTRGDEGYGIAVDSSGNAYVTGLTQVRHETG